MLSEVGFIEVKCLMWTKSRINSSIFQVPPTQIGYEQFSHGQLGIASVIIELPRSGQGTTPFGQCGICIGSTLTTSSNRNAITQLQEKYKQGKWRTKLRSRAVPV